MVYLLLVAVDAKGAQAEGLQLDEATGVGLVVQTLLVGFGWVWLLDQRGFLT